MRPGMVIRLSLIDPFHVERPAAAAGTSTSTLLRAAAARHLGARSTGLGRADRNRLLTTGYALARSAASELAPLAFVHRLLNLLLRLGSVLSHNVPSTQDNPVQNGCQGYSGELADAAENGRHYTGRGSPKVVHRLHFLALEFSMTHQSGRAARVVMTAIAGLLALAIAQPAAAQYFGQNKVQFEKLNFKVLKTAHFDIYFYDEEKDAAETAGRLADRWYSRLTTLLRHELTGRQPLVLFASHPHFAQTNVVEGQIDESTGGVTEGMQRRIALPLGATLADTDHVIGHELVHAFQYDILGPSTQAPLSLIEGMAEYLSIGPVSVQTAMWLRDAALAGDFPAIKDLDNPRYFPYRFGHAFWAYLTGVYGDEVIPEIMSAMGPPPDGRGP